ncbi:SDR family oxidoreductase [Salipaludibacillus aurantiacus]|uniref:NAD(P)-dependent dehydrogenase, short-chain alcohol dehydrogenase family n=1 Tax=Salipaludibacillus aurantiacus TaxID=1601833 RepID=A0A1H9TXC1_9BACI|nr:SDR family NAD(P)-dependent oxidoreductase [Salipaludibacillus aurantiacus]SES01403.1 NAD(P)-dependent dehydrogenase, short-chain alcohol dehydrogenase family [Salipaludibacillus aurantiacus]
MDQYTSLRGKAAVVTGGGSGMGRAAALHLAKQGVKVCLVDLKKDDLLAVKEEIESSGSEAIVAEADVSNPSELKQAFIQAASEFNQLDIVYANAGINGTVAPIEDLKPEEWDETLSTNLKSTFLTVKCAIPHMKKNGGSIILTSSINGNRVFSNFGMSAYSSSKAAQVAFGKMAALELANYNIRVNVICPGAIETNIGENTHPKEDQLEKVEIPVEYPEGNQPLEERSGKPEQVADLVCFLASDASSHITGTEMFIDGAESLL